MRLPSLQNCASKVQTVTYRSHSALAPTSALPTPTSSNTAVSPTYSGGLRRSQFVRRILAGSMFLGLSSTSRNTASAATQTAEQVLQEPNWPDAWPFRADDFGRYDETSDTLFYDQPRFVTHIDDAAINSLTKFYAKTFPPSGNKDAALLDICSSWISHYPEGYSAGRIAGLGMNEEELSRNKVLTDFTVHDLNTNPKLPYEDNSFDVITNAVSVDYLNKPLEVFKEMQRCLKPGGVAIMSFSNRCFPTKAIALWSATGDLDHVWIVGSYFHYSGGWNAPQAKEITEGGLFGKGDPMYVVWATKSA